ILLGFSAGPHHPVTSLLVEGSMLNVACAPEAVGAFAEVSQWNGHSWSRLGGEEFRGAVARLLRWKGDLIAAGALEFPDRGTYALARLKGGRWRPLGPAMDVRFAEVSDASAFQDDIIIAGVFRSSLNAISRGLLRFGPDEAGFDTLANTTGPIATQALSLAVHEGALVVSGSFRLPDDLPGTGHVLMSWNGSEWSDLGQGPFGSITALRSTSSGLLAGGNSAPSGAGQTLVGRLGPGGWTMVPGLNGTRIHALAEWRDQIAAGGDRQVLVLSGAFESGYRRLALHGRSGWHSITPRRTRAAGLERSEVRALLPFDQELVATGQLGMTWDGDAWRQTGPVVRLVDQQWQPLGQLSGTGYALAQFRGDLYAAGEFELPSRVSVGLVRFDGTEWRAVPGPREAHALAVYDGRLVIAGRFAPPHNAQLPGIAAFDGTTWSAIGPGPWPPDSTVTINALLSYRGSLYVAGCLIGIPGVDDESVARWDGTRWTALGAGVDGCLTALAGYGDGIAVGGTAGATIWDGDIWRPLPGPPGSVDALASDGSLLFLGHVRYASQVATQALDVLSVW